MFTTANKDMRDMKDDAVSKGRHAAEELKNGARRIKDDIKDDFSETVGVVRDDLQDVARAAGKRARQLADEAEETLTTRIHDNPMQSMLIALGAGFLIGALFARR